MLSFKDFLLLHSAISKEFLDDFYSLVNENYIEQRNTFLIDSEILRKWLEITVKKEFYKTIARSYKENVDYTKVKLEKKSGRGGHNEVRYLLTPEATKKICQSTRSKKGDKLRDYFIEIEFVLYKYQAYIIEGLKEKNLALQRNMKPKVNSSKRMIYIFKALNTDLTLYKLGRTYTSKTRFFSYNSAAADDIEVMFEYETENLEAVEQCVKSLMRPAKYRKYKEIYEVDIDIVKKAIRDCDCQVKSYSKEIKELMQAQLKGENLSGKTQVYMMIPNFD